MKGEEVWHKWLLKAALNKGMDIEQYVEEQLTESLCDAICTTCGYVSEDSIEPDVFDGMCPECGVPTLSSILGFFL